MGHKIEICDVSLTIKEHRILEHIHMQMEQGKIYGLIGRNGSGKTVLMKCICGFMHPSEGTIRVGEQMIGKDCDFPSDTGVVIETPEFLPYHNGYQNLKILAGLRGKIGKQEIRDAIAKAGLDPDLRTPVGKYSLGMRQRLGLAQAIMENPSLLILDEPMNGLDEYGVKEMRTFLLDLKAQGKTIIIASHSAEDIAILCDKTYRLEHGKVVQEIGE